MTLIIRSNRRIPWNLAATVAIVTLGISSIHCSHGEGGGKSAGSDEAKLLESVRAGNVEAVRQLIDRGVNINARDVDSNTALAIANKLRSSTATLTDDGHVHVTTPPPDRVAALEAIAGLLRQAGAYQDSDLLTAVAGGVLSSNSFVYRCNEAELDRLIKLGARVDYEGMSGPALVIAATNGATECAKLLLDAGANPNAEMELLLGPARTALMLAAANGHIDVVRLLVEHSADVNKKDAMGETAAQMALRVGHADVATVLSRSSGVK